MNTIFKCILCCGEEKPCYFIRKNDESPLDQPTGSCPDAKGYANFIKTTFDDLMN